MNDVDKRIKKVVNFYQSLPVDLINDIFKNFFDNQSVNRTIRRDVTKIKSLDKKIDFVMLSNLTRRIFSDAAYITIKDNIGLTLDSAEYEEIIDNITEENKIYYTIFFFRWCYEFGKDGIDNDDKYFKKFVDSELFDCILNNKTLSNNTNNESKTGIENCDSVNDKKNSNLLNEVLEMNLLGRIEKRNTFYNFFPQFKLVDGSLEEISSSELKTTYPTNGGINLSYIFSGESDRFLENEIQADLDKDLYVKSVYNVNINNSDLEENNNDTYKLKIDLEKFVRNGQKLSSIIKESGKIGLYKVVTSDSPVISLSDLTSRNVFLKEDNIIENELVFLLYDNNYYGPFKTYHRTQDGKFFIKTEANDKNYLIPFYSSDAVKSVEFEKQAYLEDPYYTSYVYIIGEESSYDAITDEILLEKIKDDISLELAINDPKEFVHCCNNSPYFANLPQSIIEKRIERLKKIINNTEKFKEEKRTVFESLLKLYDNSNSKVSDRMITDSELFKELQSKYSDERRKNDDKEKQIQTLRQEKDELNNKLTDANKNAAIGVTTEQIEQYKKENSELREELNELKKVTENITQLKDEQKKLENNNEYLRKQNTKLENESKEAMNAVNNAIDSGIEKSAEVAFDPYISNVMLKAAAQWDSKSEDDNYNQCRESLEQLPESSLCGNDLIEHIVKYVQTKRKYAYNDIINIYISIAQNFITVFSGEPGTGKTSMCNIIADTLGLFDFGPNINRFVPISVERGWSSKRDLIGYFNPLTRKYDKSNSKIYDALRILDNEKINSKYPYIIMLDEANLSPIEYYWADFMRLTDRSSESDAYINIGMEKEIFIPETLRFVATINTDQTTETLSPRLIDRACIIKLPKVGFELKKEEPKNSLHNELITWNNFVKTFSKDSELLSSTQKTIKDIYELFDAYGMTVSPRIQLGIEKYVKAAQEIMEDESDVLSREKAIDFAVMQKLLPKVNGYYSNYERFFDSLKQFCKEYHLKMTNDAIEKMIENQERNMGYCQYLI